MYEYVTKGEIAEYKAYCCDALNRLKMQLEKEHGIEAYVTLIGSGAKNMVTRNGRGPFDLDFNLVLTSILQEYEKQLKCLKELVTETLNGLVADRKFSHGKDSTSSIKYFAHARDGKTVVFSFDVAIIQKRRSSYYKLVHDKRNNSAFIWNQIRDSGDIDEKAAMIKSRGRWKDVRKDYRDLKNMYLKQGDKDHPSFIVYIQAVN